MLTLLPKATLTPADQALYDSLGMCSLPSQVRHEVESSSGARVKGVLRGVGLTYNPAAKVAEVKAMLADEWIAAMNDDDEQVADTEGDEQVADDEQDDDGPGGDAETVEFKTGEELLDDIKKAKVAAKKVKAEKPADPHADARKARYAEAERIKAEAAAAGQVTDDEVIDWIATQRAMDPGAVCAKEMEVYRWVEGRKIGHQRWNELWQAATAQGGDDDEQVEDEPQDEAPEGGDEQVEVDQDEVDANPPGRLGADDERPEGEVTTIATGMTGDDEFGDDF